MSDYEKASAILNRLRVMYGPAMHVRVEDILNGTSKTELDMYYYYICTSLL